MWQSLIKQWVYRAAQERLREAAQNGGARQGPSAADARKAASADETAAQQASGPAAPPAVCHVGLVFALGIEAGALSDRLAGVVRTDGANFIAHEGGLNGRRLVLLESGAGGAAAAQGARALIAGHRPQWVISAGFAGGLDDRLKQHDILMASEIVDTAGRCFTLDLKVDEQSARNTPGLHVGRLLTVDQIIHEPDEKRALGRRHAALAVDMESMAVAEVCRDAKARFLAVRVISDTVDRRLPRDIDYLMRKKSTAGRLGAAAGAIIRRPASVKDLWQLKEDALVASQRLAKFLGGAIDQLF